MISLIGFSRSIFIGFAALVAAALAHMTFPTAASAQSDSKYLTLLGIPSATTAPRGVSFASVYAAFESDGGRHEALSFGHGFGDADNGVGLQISATLGSMQGPFENYGYLGLKASRRLAAGHNPTYLGLSVDRLSGWGEADGIDPAYSLAVTRFSQLQFGASGDSFPVMFSIGVGSAVDTLGNSGGGFVGMGIGLTETLGASAAWNGDNVTLGTAYRPKKLKNVAISAMLEDAFDQDDRQRISLTISVFGRDIFGR